MTEGISLEDLIARIAAEGEITPEEATILKSSLADPEAAAKSLPQSWLNEQDESHVESDIRQQLMDMTIPEKIKLALFGNSVARGILIFSPNKIIQEFVLKNPRLGAGEIEAFLKSTTISDNVIRLISRDPDSMKSYKNKLLLVSNPKTPQDLSLKWLRYLNDTDLKRLSKSKNVPNLVSQGARRLVSD